MAGPSTRLGERGSTPCPPRSSWPSSQPPRWPGPCWRPSIRTPGDLVPGRCRPIDPPSPRPCPGLAAGSRAGQAAARPPRGSRRPLRRGDPTHTALRTRVPGGGLPAAAAGARGARRWVGSGPARGAGGAGRVASGAGMPRAARGRIGPRVARPVSSVPTTGGGAGVVVSPFQGSAAAAARTGPAGPTHPTGRRPRPPDDSHSRRCRRRLRRLRPRSPVHPGRCHRGRRR